MKSLTSVLLLPLIAACGGEPTDRWLGTVDTLETGVILINNPATGTWDSATAWALDADLLIGSVEADTMETFAEVLAVDADGTGRIYVLDGQYQEIRVFNRDGDYVRTIGRTGGGPGEFRGAFGMSFDGDGRLWVADVPNARYSVFDTSGAFITVYRREVTRYGYRWEGGHVASGALYDYTGVTVGEERKPALVRYDPVEGYADTVQLPEFDPPVFDFRNDEGLGSIAMMPFGSNLRWVIDPRGYIWAGISSEFCIYQISLAGDTLRAVQREFAPVEVTGDEREAALDRIERSAQGRPVDASRIPSQKPAFDRFVVDEYGYLWVLPSRTAEQQGTFFDVFDPEGTYLGQLHTDVDVWRYAQLIIRGDNIYTVATDELDVQYVVRIRIIR